MKGPGSHLRSGASPAGHGPFCTHDEVGLLSREVPEQLEVGHQVQHIVVACQLCPLDPMSHGHRPAPPAVCQAPGETVHGGAGMRDGAKRYCLEKPWNTSQTLSMTRVDPMVGGGIVWSPAPPPPSFCTSLGCLPGWGLPGANLCRRMSPATSSPVLQECTGQENWSPGADAGFSQDASVAQACSFPACLPALVLDAGSAPSRPLLPPPFPGPAPTSTC